VAKSGLDNPAAIRSVLMAEALLQHISAQQRTVTAATYMTRFQTAAMECLFACSIMDWPPLWVLFSRQSYSYLFRYHTLTQKNNNASRGLKNAGPQSLSRADEDVPP
jgi:hypothetical protein